MEGAKVLKVVPWYYHLYVMGNNPLLVVLMGFWQMLSRIPGWRYYAGGPVSRGADSSVQSTLHNSSDMVV